MRRWRKRARRKHPAARRRGHTITASLRNLPYHPINDSPAWRTSAASSSADIAAAIPATSVKIHVLCEEQPGKLNYASPAAAAPRISPWRTSRPRRRGEVHILQGDLERERCLGRAHAAMPSNISALSFTRSRACACSRSPREVARIPARLPTAPRLCRATISIPGSACSRPRHAESAGRADQRRMGILLKDPAMLERLDKQVVVPARSARRSSARCCRRLREWRRS